MDFSKIKKISFILLILFIVLFPFWCVRGLCSEEDYGVIQKDDIILSVNGELVSATGRKSYFLPIEKGYTYTVTFNNNNADVRIGFTNGVNVGDTVYNYSSVAYDYTITINSNDYSYLYFGFGDIGLQSVTYSIERTVNAGFDNAVAGLVDNVGINSIWNIFDISINYIVVVVLFAFGCYIIFRIIKKVSRGKEGL